MHFGLEGLVRFVADLKLLARVFVGVAAGGLHRKLLNLLALAFSGHNLKHQGETATSKPNRRARTANPAANRR